MSIEQGKPISLSDIDSTPQENSNNLITSGGVYSHVVSSIQEAMASNKLLDDINDTTIDTNEVVKEISSNLLTVSSSISGESSATGYGTGAMGDITYNASNTVWPKQDSYGRYVWNCTNFTLPSGQIMTPPEKCNGLYIYATNSISINGEINMVGQRLTLNGPNGISNFIEINDEKYYLAVGGNTVKGGDGGAGGCGALRYNKYWSDFVDVGTAETYYKKRIVGGMAENIIYAGNINGGGCSTYGLGAKGYKNGQAFEYSQGPWSGTEGIASVYQPATGALILASPTISILTNGFLNCSAVPGTPCQPGQNGEVVDYSTTYYDVLSGTCGNGGNGAIAPSGGGPITIISKNFSNAGTISTKGDRVSCTRVDGTDARVSYDFNDYDSYFAFCGAGYGGEGGDFISQAGQLKIYIVQ